MWLEQRPVTHVAFMRAGGASGAGRGRAGRAGAPSTKTQAQRMGEKEQRFVTFFAFVVFQYEAGIKLV
jgi:hypothetical protein